LKSGSHPDDSRPASRDAWPPMPRYLLCHRHRPDECAAAFAAWKGFASPLRQHPTVASCAFGGHEIWWELEAASEAAALDRLPPYVAERATATRVADVLIP
jgi:hypothetical protein